MKRIEKNLKNIIWYSSYESSKTGKCNTFPLSYLIHGHNNSGFALIRMQDILEDYSSNHTKGGTA